jgi:hypothetical protein
MLPYFQESDIMDNVFEHTLMGSLVVIPPFSLLPHNHIVLYTHAFHLLVVHFRFVHHINYHGVGVSLNEVVSHLPLQSILSTILWSLLL